MGKNKNKSVHQVKKNIFKVAGSRSLKSKNKAKSVVAAGLKSLNVKNRQKIDDIDKQLSTLNAEIRQASTGGQNPTEPKPSLQTRSEEARDEILQYNKSEKKIEDAIDQLVTMNM